MILIGLAVIDNAVDWLNKTFHQILLLLDGCVYWAVSQTYQIFLKLASARIFKDAFFSNFAKRIYAIIGVVMLFYLAYSLLTMLIDPDKMTQGDKGLPKLAQNIVISLVLLGLLPTIFDYAYKVQGIIFKENVIGAIIFGSGGANDNASLAQYGNYMAYTALNPFLNPGNYNVNLKNAYSWFNLKQDLLERGEFTKLPVLGDWSIEPQPLISDAVDAKEGDMVELGYKPGLSTVAGIALLYIMVSFCVDLGIRIIKFAFCQLIAPIPIIMRMVPGKKGVFDKWLKLTMTVYFEVFIRVGIMYMAVYFFSEIANMEIFKYASGGIQGLVVLAIILMGLFAFAKQAPKMIGDMLGLDSGNLKLGIKDKLKAGGFFAAGGAIGAGAVSGVRNLSHRVTNVGKSWKTAAEDFKSGNLTSGFKNVGKGIWTGLGTIKSVPAGMASGLIQGGKKGYSAKGYGEMVKSINEGATIAETNRDKRENYKANHKLPIVGVPLGHAADAVQGAAKYIGFGDSLERLKSKQQAIEEVSSARKAVMDSASYVLENIDHNNRTVYDFEYTNAAGVKSKVLGGSNLGLMMNQLEHLKNTGASAADIYDMQLQIEGAKKKAKNDIIAGLKADGVNRVDPKDYNGELKANMTKLMTATRKSATEISANITDSDNKTALKAAKDFADKYYNKDISQLISDTSFDATILTTKISKPTLEAKSAINTKINKHYEDLSKKGK